MEAEYSRGHGHGHFVDVSGDRHHIQADANRELEKELILNTPSRLEGKTRILQASDVLLSLAGRSSTSESLEPSPAVENFQEALRLFPPFRDDDGPTLGAAEVKCPDCEAVFTSEAELKQHYLTRYCSGSAIAVYVMTRDRLITKGYRMEKRLVPLDCRPIRFFCNNCERPFSLSEDDMVERQQDTSCLVDCTHCSARCNVLYEPLLNDPRDDTSYRDIQKEIASGNTSQAHSPSLIQKGSVPSKFLMTDFGGDQSLAKRARKLRDSWSFRKISQSDEEEMLAISFAGLYDLEKVHAPNGIYKALPAGPEMGLSDASFCSSGFGESTMLEPEKTDLCEDNCRNRASDLDNSDDRLITSNEEYEMPRMSKRQSFFQKLFGKKVPFKMPRSRSGRGKKLMKRANAIRFSFVTKYSRNESRAAVRDSAGSSGDALAQGMDDTQNNSLTTVQDAEYVALVRGAQNVFVHMQYISGGAIVHDVSGRQRILQVDEVANLFLQMKNGLSSATALSQALNTRLRGEMLLKQGNAQGAVVEFHNAMKILDDLPGLDIEKQTRAGILHSMGQAYRSLDIPAEAEACYLESLGLYKRAFGRDHARNYTVLHDLGGLCEKDGYATEAAALYERSFAGRLKTLGQNAPETLSSMQNLASLKVLLGDLESALLLLEKAVPALNEVFGIQNATTLNAMNKLSLLYQKLGLEKESRAICARTIPHCRTVFVVRYIQSTETFNFPPDVQDIITSYKRSRDGDCLRVVHRLGRAYMDAGLNRDAANLFETLVEDFLAVKGPEAPETFDALSALCVSREHLDAVDKAVLAYQQLVHMAKRTPEQHHSRKRIGYAEKRIAKLNRRREVLEMEKREWGVKEAAPCQNCGCLTSIRCKTCNITPLCSESCRKKASSSHIHIHPHNCIPSVTLRQSKSLAIKPKTPISARDQALSKIKPSRGSNIGIEGVSIKNAIVTASYTFYLDPRNFSTIRMKLRSGVNTIILFSLDSDVEYALVGTDQSTPDQLGNGGEREREQSRGRLALSRPTTSSRRNALVSKLPDQNTARDQNQKKYQGITWISPQTQDCISHTPIPNPKSRARTSSGNRSTSSSSSTKRHGQSQSQTKGNESDKYILLKPGPEMLKTLLDKRLAVRSGSGSGSGSKDGNEKDMFVSSSSSSSGEGLTPTGELIEYAQGLLLTGYLGEVVMYVFEWVWR
ncbi:tetratricopeptide repeat protein [Aspergillus stella-maris]|uniref:tetratricopeptide repeat protein n=1 Tax=Aspergillus stella-maris TaxID=1810926 RepID=UPI003CCE20E0